jgi:predicted amidophosphoribosyltransferase
MGLCERCRGILVHWPEGEERGEGACDRKLSTWWYQPPIDKVVMALKFRRLDYLGEHLGRAMAEIHREDLGDGESHIVTAVPLFWTRYLARGYNQAALIARPLAAPDSYATALGSLADILERHARGRHAREGASRGDRRRADQPRPERPAPGGP